MIRKSLCLCLSALAIASLFAVSCGKTETVEQAVYAPVITISSSAVKVASDGGACTITYTIDNTAEDGTITCASDVNWISDVDGSTAGTVRFNVADNSAGAQRTGHISITYATSAANVSEIVTFAQSPGVSPEIVVQPTAIAAGIDGGSYSFTYSINNPVDDGELTCDTSADWIYAFDYSVSGTVSFTVDEADETSLRQADINIYYTYSSGAANETVTVIQDFVDEFIPDYSTIVGTYEAHGILYDKDNLSSDDGIESTWTIKIYESAIGDYAIFDGLIPDVAGAYAMGGDNAQGYPAKGTLVSRKEITIYPQFTGYEYPMNGQFYWLAWALCSQYVPDDNGKYTFHLYNGADIPMTLKYDNDTETWTADYGMLLALYKEANFDDPDMFYTYFNVFAPGMTMKRISTSTEDEEETSVKTASWSPDSLTPVDRSVSPVKVENRIK